MQVIFPSKLLATTEPTSSRTYNAPELYPTLASSSSIRLRQHNSRLYHMIAAELLNKKDLNTYQIKYYYKDLVSLASLSKQVWISTMPVMSMNKKWKVSNEIFNISHFDSKYTFFPSSYRRLEETIWPFKMLSINLL